MPTLLTASTRHVARRNGFTLVEVLIAAAIAGTVLAAVAQMTLSLGRINFNSVAKLVINRAVRSFTNELSLAGRSTRDYRIYASTENLAERQSGQSGDVLVMVWADPAPLGSNTGATTAHEFYCRRVIAFARTVEDADANTGPVVRFERNFPAPGQPGALKSSETTIATLTRELLAANPSSDVTRREVLQLTRGLADGRLFFHSRTGRSIVVNGEIFHDNRAREVTNTYNFTVTPRG